ncbi:hypothetical protein M427DRAFT_36081 [Gonapodya prolifera JEL478]|uniref:Amino acid permease/ SLC12A domain-containing protein n=1 Tax=Gonapodya prolifera (strain JEL478) TaxID=1344416 RepID=A0A139A2Y9_GONPJ|nr:hypothetical protein M427DRAFT_36081 [Gonapodya prolifera JEL478]|eukprot:KXS11167.1 hypothetical protein M427DRAFT_36081 [Gonapodya prolifera JEL478]
MVLYVPLSQSHISNASLPVVQISPPAHPASHDGQQLQVLNLPRLNPWPSTSATTNPSASLGQASIRGGSQRFTTVFYAYGGTELVGLTSREAVNPMKNVPNATRGAFIRILIFYMSTVLVIGLVIPVTDPTLSTSECQSGAGHSN